MAHSQDILFTIQPDFPDAKLGCGLYYCPECASVIGVLSYYPQLREQLDVRTVDFLRPRPEIIDLLGSEAQGCPVLVLDEDSTISLSVIKTSPVTGRRYVSGFPGIADYLAERYQIARAH